MVTSVTSAMEIAMISLQFFQWMLPPRAAGFLPLLVTQALTAFHHNQLRAAVVTMAAFSSISQSGFSAGSVAALTTLLLVAPYVLLSLAAGRLADRWPRALVIRWCKAVELPVALIGGSGLLLGETLLIMPAILLAGLQASVLAPAKFALLPELLDRKHLVSGNAWITTTSTLSVLLGLISGNLLALAASGPLLLAATGGGCAILGLLLSFAIPVLPQAVGTTAMPGDWRTTWTMLARLARDRVLTLAVAGSSWFWFQGVFTITLLPLYVADQSGQSQALVSLLLVASTIGVAAGALLARLAEPCFGSRWLPVVVAVCIALPAFDLGTAGAGAIVARQALDLAALSAGTGLFIVAVGMAVQVLSPLAERARFIALNHVFNGLAMLAAGSAVAILDVMGVSPTEGIAGAGLATGLVVLVVLLVVLPLLRRTATMAAPLVS